MSDEQFGADHPTCKVCGVAYTLEEGEIVDNFPQVLLCGHIFCTSCLRLLELNNAITCPECKVESMLPEGGVEGLEVDSRIIGLIYTAKINKMKKPKKHRRHSSPSPEKQETKQGKDVEAKRALREALTQASLNMTTLKNVYQALLKGYKLQVKREKARLLKEIDKVIEKTFTLVTKRQADLVAELNHVEQHFPCSRKELRRVEARMSDLATAIKKAHQVQRHPPLESYCHLDQLLETLQAPVDVHSFDMKGLSLDSGISYIVHSEELKKSLTACLKSIVGDPKMKEALQGDGEWNPVEAEPHTKAAQLPPNPVSDIGPNVLIEEIYEESEPERAAHEETLKSCHQVTTASSNAAERPPTPGPQAHPQPTSERHRLQRTNRKIHDENSGRHGVVAEFVIVSHVENPNHFYVRHAVEEKASVSLSKKINSLCSGDSGLFTANDTLEAGSTVLAKWREGMWGRATLTEVFQRGHQGPVPFCPVPQLDRISVFFQDYGFCNSYSFQSEEVSSEGLIKDLNQQVRTLCMSNISEINRWPPQAIRCSLKDIVPVEVTKGWSIEAKDEFLHAVGPSSVEMQVFATEGSALLVDLKIFPSSSKRKTTMSLREYLVLLELARFYCPVVWNSKMAHGGRKPLQFYSPVFPRPNTELNALVYHIDTLSHFYIQLVDNSEFQLLTSKLQDYYSCERSGRGGRSDDPSMDVCCPVVGQACVARLDDKVWYRAQIIDIPGSRKVEVQCVDFGNKKVISVNDIKKLKDEFFSLPAMAIQCCLADVTFLEDDETWSEAAIEKFKSLVDHTLVTAVATESGKSSKGLPVQLFKTGSSSKILDNIAEILVNEHMACFKKCNKSRDTQIPVVDTTVWDPPLEAEAAPATSGQEISEINEDPEEIQPNLVLPACLKNLRVRVTHVVSPGSFYVQLLNKDKQLKRLSEVLKQEYSRTEPQDVAWKADMYCAAYNNGVWERGQICTAVPLKGIAEVLRCDFGNKVKLHVDNLRPLLPSLVGFQLLECALSDIRPAGGRSTWTATACDFISYYLTGAQAVMTITEINDLRPVPVTLYCSNRAGRDVSIADFLVSEGLALKDRVLRSAPEKADPEKAASENADPEKSATEKAAPERAAPEPNLEETADSKFRVLENRPPNPENRPPSNQSAQHRPLNAVPPMPAPRTNPPPEKVKTQAYCPPELPHCGRVQMTVSAIGDDGVIYARTHHAELQFEQLRERLQLHIKTLPRLKPYKWKSVLGCVVMGSDMLWNRAHLLEVIGGHVKVRYVDQGLVENIPVCHVYPTMLCEDIPQLCIPCQLYGVIPVGKTWQCDATALLKELLLNRCVDLQVMELPADPLGCLTVHISLDGMSVGTIMVHHQHASADQTVEALREDLLPSSNLDLDDWDLDLEGFEKSEPVLRVLTYPDLPEKGQRFPVNIKHLRTPNEVFLYLLEDDSCVESGGESLEEALKDVNDGIDKLAVLSDFAIEAPCLAQYIDGKYYRAKLLGFAGLNPVKLLVRHVDFGSDDTLPTHKLRQMPAHLLQYPCKAIKVCVAGFKPPTHDQETERLPYQPVWSIKAVLEMISLLHSCRTASVTATDPELAVFLYDEDGVLIHLPLVEKGLAEFD